MQSRLGTLGGSKSVWRRTPPQTEGLRAPNEHIILDGALRPSTKTLCTAAAAAVGLVLAVVAGCTTQSPAAQADRERKAAGVVLFKLHMNSDLWSRTNQEKAMFHTLKIEKPKNIAAPEITIHAGPASTPTPSGPATSTPPRRVDAVLQRIPRRSRMIRPVPKSYGSWLRLHVNAPRHPRHLAAGNHRHIPLRVTARRGRCTRIRSLDGVEPAMRLRGTC